METCQANINTKSPDLSKYSRSTNLLCAMKINKLHTSIVQNPLSLWTRLFCVESPIRKLCSYMYSSYLQSGAIIPGTLHSRLVCNNISPISCALQKTLYEPNNNTNDGLIDSLRMLILSEHFNKPYSDDHQLAVMLTRSF